MVTIIEPHGDDALISCSSVLASGVPVRIVTVFDDRPSQKIAQYYPNVQVISLNIDRFRGTQYADRPKASEFATSIEKREPVWECWKDKVLQDNKDLFEDVKKSIEPYVVGTVYTLIGCLHAQHIMVREAVLQLNPERAIFAAEPAIRFRRIGMLAERAAVKALNPSKTKTRKSDAKKIEVFKKVYTTETYLIRSKSLEDDFMESEVFWKC